MADRATHERGKLAIAAGLAARALTLVGASLAARVHSGIPARPSDLTSEWLTQALATQWPGIEVTAARTIDATEGTTSRARLEVECSAAGPAGVPPTIFAKVAPGLGHRLLLTGIGLIEGEILFYRDLGTDVPVRVPATYHVSYDAPSARFVLLLEDVAEAGSRFGIATEPVTPDEAGTVLDALARLHGAFWESPRLAGDLAWLQAPMRGPFHDFYRVVSMNLGKGITRAGERVPDVLPGPKVLLEAYHALERVNDAPRTLLHGDPHLGNLWFTAGGEPGFLDWQVVRQGRWAHDVGYFLVSALTIEDRRASERDLVARYVAALAEAGAPDLSVDDAWLQYRRQPAYGLCMWLGTLAHGDYQSDAVSLANVERFAAAAVDLETLDALG